MPSSESRFCSKCGKAKTGNGNAPAQAHSAPVPNKPVSKKPLSDRHAARFFYISNKAEWMRRYNTQGRSFCPSCEKCENQNGMTIVETLDQFYQGEAKRQLQLLDPNFWSPRMLPAIILDQVADYNVCNECIKILENAFNYMCERVWREEGWGDFDEQMKRAYGNR